MAETPLRGVMIGAGTFAGHHIDAWTRLPGVRITAIGDLDPIRADDLAQSYGVSARFTDWREMIDDQEPDFVDIVTPPEAHAEQCRYAAARGVHVVCQRPLAPSVDEAAALIADLSRLPVRVMVHENWRWQPWYRRTFELLASGALGEPSTLSFRMRTGEGWSPDAYADTPAGSRPRLLLDQMGGHFVDAFGLLLGEVTSVYARTQRVHPAIKGEDGAVVVLGFAEGATAVLDASRYHETTAADPQLTFGTMRLDCSAGHLLLDADGSLTLHPLGGIPQPVDLDVPETGFAGDSVLATQRHFLHGLRSGMPFETEASDHLRSLEIVEAMYASAERGEAVRLR